jgi:hypothetical protein
MFEKELWVGGLCEHPQPPIGGYGSSINIFELIKIVKPL